MQEQGRNILLYQKKYGKGKDRRNKRSPDESPEGFEINTTLLMSCYNAWNSLSTLRKDIRRNEEFVFGDQWSDRVYDYKKRQWKTERQMLVEQGLQPSQYNIIRGIMRSIDGVWASSKTLPTCIAQKDDNKTESEVLTATLHSHYRKNELRKLTRSQLQQLLISGIAVTKNHYVNRDGESDIVNDYIDLFTFFLDNTMKDPRYKDCTLVGCFYDMATEDIAGKFSKGSKKRAQAIREMYSSGYEERFYQFSETFTDQRIEKDFFTPGREAEGLGRVIEVWRKETAECYWVHDYLSGKYGPDFKVTEKQLKAENARRAREQSAMGVTEEDMLLLEWTWGTDNFWKYYYLTPYGEILDCGINPFWHEKPPFVFELHDFFVGKIYPFMKDLIDANKQINKLSAISELLTRYSAKSVMFMPVESIATDQGYGIDYIEQKSTDYDTVIPYKAQGMAPHQKPEYVNTVAQAFTPLNVVNMYLKLSENVSGVYGALQGQQPTSGTPAQMYAQQSQNSATSLNGVFDAIRSFRMRGDKINVQLMQQYYDGKRWIFDKDAGKRVLWDPEKVRNIDFEMSISENTDTPAYKLLVNDILMQLKQFDVNNMIDLRGLIEVGEWPFKDKLLDYLNNREKQISEMGAGMGQPGAGTLGHVPIPEDLQQEMGQYQFTPEIQAQFEQLPPSLRNFVVEQAQAMQQN